ncbi:MAG TPA: ABC transporter ATP-binding protein [Stellaceae bacterium]|nr:ABC transporter ATP-binding protein [Stellaceae bacterium]
MSETILSIAGVSRRFVGLLAVDQVSFEVSRGEILSIIGPNGAGKTTLFNLLTGQLRPTAGTVTYRGEVVNRLPPEQRARRGMGRTFQIAKPFLALSALENVMIGAFLRDRGTAAARDNAFAVLEEVGLADRAEVSAAELTLSERRRLEVARALALKPDLILLDEVMAGLNPTEVQQQIDLVHQLNRQGLTLLVIEHNLKVVRSFARRVLVLARGALIADGAAETVLETPAVVEAYLGSRRR